MFTISINFRTCNCHGIELVFIEYVRCYDYSYTLRYGSHTYKLSFFVHHWSIYLSSSILGIPSISEHICVSLNPCYQVNPILNLTCISYGDSATNMTWKQDRQTVHCDGNNTCVQTVKYRLGACYNTYENVLTTNAKVPGNYQCCVTNVSGEFCSQELNWTGNIFSMLNMIIISTNYINTHLFYTCVVCVTQNLGTHEGLTTMNIMQYNYASAV